MRTRAASFARGAALYDARRPGYPDELVTDVLAYGAATLAAGALDVGAGSGKATVPLARAGVRVTALDPSTDMLGVLTERCAQAGVDGLVTPRRGTFEDLDPADGRFGLVVSAQAFHWTDPATRWPRLVSLLVPGGAAALFWNGWHLDPQVHDLGAVAAAYQEHAPQVVPDLPQPHDDPWPGDELAATDGLTDHEERRYRWSLSMDAQAYGELLSTQSSYAVLPTDVRDRLLAAVTAAVGPQVQLVGGTRLHLARAGG